jgi:topoisomerase-4 subunit A
VKRFLVEDTDKKSLFITEHEKSFLELVSTDHHTVVDITFAKPRGKDAKENELLNLLDFIAVKGMKALGNKLSGFPIKELILLESVREEEPVDSSGNSDKDIDDLAEGPNIEMQIKKDDEEQMDLF